LQSTSSCHRATASSGPENSAVSKPPAPASWWWCRSIFVLLYGLFNSVRDSLLALAGIPFAVGGGLLALYLAGLHFGVATAIGFISLFGVAVMDGISTSPISANSDSPA